MKLSMRYALDILFVASGAFLVAVAIAFSAPVAGWIGFGVFTGLAVTAAASAAMTGTYARKTGHGIIAVVALWALIAALVFSGPALGWLVFANAVGLGLIALADLTAHEVTTENVVHRLEVTAAPEETHRRTAA